MYSKVYKSFIYPKIIYNSLNKSIFGGMNMEEKIVSRRNGKIINFGDSVGLTLREELMDLGLNPDDNAQITVFQDQEKKKKIVIEKI